MRVQKGCKRKNLVAAGVGVVAHKYLSLLFINFDDNNEEVEI